MGQHTIASAVRIEGKGLHSGCPVVMELSPAPEDTGVVFYRRDHPEFPPLKARASSVVNTERCTILGNSHFTVSTVEHLLAACCGSGIDNLAIHIDAGEVPVLDGSALPFCNVLLKAGRCTQKKDRRSARLRKPFWIARGESLIAALPSDTLRFTVLIDYEHPLVGVQVFEYTLAQETFLSEVAPARTFGLWEEVKILLEKNLARGGDLENALVIMPEGYSSPLRLPLEPVRHKCLDLIGDYFLAGAAIPLHIVSIRAGHALNAELVKYLESLEVIENGGKGDKKDTASPVPVSHGGQDCRS
ncbi:MAG: UDP-3-O-acyl-N-acetylglucosamine deacetylase [Candidatus Eremiobacteraeota bacterium]|nr:UDP-3-O-acyl-N-acetylglucosamine deacetylase [Candidatus Eremiobacteraeota bacterium]